MKITVRTLADTFHLLVDFKLTDIRISHVIFFMNIITILLLILKSAFLCFIYKEFLYQINFNVFRKQLKRLKLSKNSG